MKEIIENRDGSLSFRVDGEEVEHWLKEDAVELYKARRPVLEYIKNNHKYQKCFLCGKGQISESHVIKREVLATMSYDSEKKYRKLYSLTPYFLGSISVFTEDKSQVPHSEAFTFKLICGDCDSEFSYEDKSQSKEKYSSEELRSIALKIRLKELYDLKEKLIVSKYIPKTKWESSICSGIGSNDYSRLVKDEEEEVLKIYRGEKEFEAIIDTTAPFRIPFASEFFLSPKIFPISGGTIERNVITLSGTIGDIAPFYALMEPSGNPADDWSRITAFIEKDDKEMRKWSSEFLKNCGKTKKDLINELVSYHISWSAKNFVMRYDISKSFLKKIHSFRSSSLDETHRINFNWVKAAKLRSVE